MIYGSVTELIGATPLIEVSRYSREKGLETPLLCKLECFNPAGSAKDRVAREIIERAEKEGKLKAGGCVVEATSGNTGIALASICASRGYGCIIVMPDTMSLERRLLMKAYGAELVLTDGKLGMKGANQRAAEIVADTEGAFLASQFENSANPLAHERTTGPEIWQDTEGRVDLFVSCIGTGGTLSGTGRYLKNKNPHIKIIGVEPVESPLLTKGVAGPHKIQGIGANFVPDTLDRDIYDEIIAVDSESAYKESRRLTLTEGLLCGISSGAALSAAVKIAMREENRGKRIVALLPDTGERYLSTPDFID